MFESKSKGALEEEFRLERLKMKEVEMKVETRKRLVSEVMKLIRMIKQRASF